MQRHECKTVFNEPDTVAPRFYARASDRPEEPSRRNCSLTPIGGMSSESGYPKLDISPSAAKIRVLDLLPGSWKSEIRAALRVLDLKSSTTSCNDHFEALSYTWGSATENHYVSIVGWKRVPVTENLFRALRRLREASSLWIDAVCIDQSNYA